jgi:hypothetical protein
MSVLPWGSSSDDKNIDDTFFKHADDHSNTTSYHNNINT